MNFLKLISLMAFSFGMATVTKYYEFAEWIEKEPQIAFLMIVLGASGIVLLWGEETL